MKSRYFIICSLCICLNCNLTQQAQAAYTSDNIENIAVSDAQAKRILQTINQFPKHTQFAVALIEGDDVVFYGIQNENNQFELIDNSKSSFEIGSITKVFTSNLLIHLINENKINSINDVITPFIKFKIANNPDITFLQLANHTSGLPGDLSVSIFSADKYNPYKKYDEKRFEAFFSKKDVMQNTPGEKYQYSNVGVALLAHVLCNITNTSYENLLQVEILKPVGMTNTSSDRNNIKGLLVQGYNWKGKETPYWDLAEMRGAGAIISNVSDMSKYAIWNFSSLKNQLSIMTESTFKVNDNTEVAVGWHLIKNKTESPFLWHNGGTGGFKSSMAINPDNKTSVIVLTNVGATGNPNKGLIDQLCFDLMKTLEEG